jgi:hypothetical protein
VRAPGAQPLLGEALSGQQRVNGVMVAAMVYLRLGDIEEMTTVRSGGKTFFRNARRQQILGSVPASTGGSRW